MEKTMKIKGMMCKHCEARVKNALEALPEVSEAVVSHKKDTAKVKLSAEISDEALKKAGEAPGKSSVYRMLSALCETGEVTRHRLPPPETGHTYQYVGDAHRCSAHFHLHCLRCGAVMHLECGCGAQIAARLAATHGFFADPGRSVFYGTCAACAREEEEGGAL